MSDPGSDSDSPPPRLARGPAGRSDARADDLGETSSSSDAGAPAPGPPPAPPPSRAAATRPPTGKKTAKGKGGKAEGKGGKAEGKGGKGDAKGKADAKGKPGKAKGKVKGKGKGVRKDVGAGAGAGPGKKMRKAMHGAGSVDDEAAAGGAASSGDEYSTDMFSNYIGQTGACAALGLAACDVLNMSTWNMLSDAEKDSLRVHLPRVSNSDAVVQRLLSGESLHFGSPRDRVFDDVVAGLTHPRVRRWRQRVALAERRHHIAGLREYHNRLVRELSAYKTPREAADDILAHLAWTGGDVSKAGDALLSLPERVEVTAAAAARSPTNDWDLDRWRRVLRYRNEETERYRRPERAFEFHNPWGRSIVAPLKRGPALDGGRPREHDLLRSERPSHVTILCIVRDAASRMPHNRGTRADICELLRDSQYLREGATFQQLNTVVSGALDRLHYENNAPVQYDSEVKEWRYLHNDLAVDDFEVPEWAAVGGAYDNAGGSEVLLSAMDGMGGSMGGSGGIRGVRKKKKKKK